MFDKILPETLYGLTIYAVSLKKYDPRVVYTKEYMHRVVDYAIQTDRQDFLEIVFDCYQVPGESLTLRERTALFKLLK